MIPKAPTYIQGTIEIENDEFIELKHNSNVTPNLMYGKTFVVKVKKGFYFFSLPINYYNSTFVNRNALTIGSVSNLSFGYTNISKDSTRVNNTFYDLILEFSYVSGLIGHISTRNDVYNLTTTAPSVPYFSFNRGAGLTARLGIFYPSSQIQVPYKQVTMRVYVVGFTYTVQEVNPTTLSGIVYEKIYTNTDSTFLENQGNGFFIYPNKSAIEILQNNLNTDIRLGHFVKRVPVYISQQSIQASWITIPATSNSDPNRTAADLWNVYFTVPYFNVNSTTHDFSIKTNWASFLGILNSVDIYMPDLSQYNQDYDLIDNNGNIYGHYTRTFSHWTKESFNDNGGDELWGPYNVSNNTNTISAGRNAPQIQYLNVISYPQGWLFWLMAVFTYTRTGSISSSGTIEYPYVRIDNTVNNYTSSRFQTTESVPITAYDPRYPDAPVSMVANLDVVVNNQKSLDGGSLTIRSSANVVGIAGGVPPVFTYVSIGSSGTKAKHDTLIITSSSGTLNQSNVNSYNSSTGYVDIQIDLSNDKFYYYLPNSTGANLGHPFGETSIVGSVQLAVYSSGTPKAEDLDDSYTAASMSILSTPSSSQDETVLGMVKAVRNTLTNGDYIEFLLEQAETPEESNFTLQYTRSNLKYPSDLYLQSYNPYLYLDLENGGEYPIQFTGEIEGKSYNINAKLKLDPAVY